MLILTWHAYTNQHVNFEELHSLLDMLTMQVNSHRVCYMLVSANQGYQSLRSKNISLTIRSYTVVYLASNISLLAFSSSL